MSKKVFSTPGAVLVALGIFLAALVILLPDTVVENMVIGRLEENTPLTVEASGFRKSLPFGFVTDGAAITVDGVDIVVLESLAGQFMPLGMLLGKPGIRLDGRVGNGTVTGTAVMSGRGGAAIELSIEAVPLSGIEALALYGLTGEGALNARVNVELRPGECPEGRISAEGSAVDIKDLANPFPGLLFGDRVDFTLNLDAVDCTAFLKGLWVEGAGVSAKLNGTIKLADPLEASTLELSFEVIPAKDYAGGESPLLPLLKPYKKSSNYYLMHVSGTLGKPTIGK